MSMRKLLLGTGIACAMFSPALAETSIFACRAQDGTPAVPPHSTAKLDTSKHTLTWLGTVYKNVKSLPAGIALAMLSPALAETYTYACQVKDGPLVHLYAAKFDASKHTLTWRGTVYKNVEQDLGCDAKACFSDGNKKITLSTATQGVASLSVVSGADGVEEFNCDAVVDYGTVTAPVVIDPAADQCTNFKTAIQACYKEEGDYDAAHIACFHSVLAKVEREMNAAYRWRLNGSIASARHDLVSLQKL
jgi:hypothetical protein